MRKRLILGVLLTLSISILGIIVPGERAHAVGSYPNALIADTALGYVGQWGGNACRDAGRSGATGGSPGGVSGDGQCRAFVNCIVWMASGHTQWLGGSDYFQPFLNAGGTEITDINSLVKGDIIQIGQGTHTTIIVSHVSGNTFNVVDSNHLNNDELVRNYNRTVVLDSNDRAFRLGTVGGPPPPPTPSLSSPNLLSNASFGEGGFQYWSTDPVNGGNVNTQAYQGTSAHTGSWFGESNTTTPDGSILQNLAVTTQPGQSYTFSVWIRSAAGQGPVSGTLSLWGLGGTTEAGQTNFTVGNAWTLVSAPLDVGQAGHTQLRAQIYENTANANYDFDGATLASGDQWSPNVPPALTSSSSTQFTVGTSGSFDVSASGSPTPSLSDSGVLPSGVSFTDNGNGTGALSGTPAAGTAGNYSITVTASNGVPSDANRAFTLTVWQAPAVTSAPGVTFVQWTPSSFTPNATGYPAPIISENGTLPTGVTYTSAGLSGTPTQSGTFPITFTAHNGVGAPSAQAFTLTVLPIGITSTSLPNGSVYSLTNPVSYTAKLHASGGNLPYTWSLVSGSLPPGLTLSSTGKISGRATTAGTYIFKVKVVDTLTGTPPTRNKAKATLSITIG